MQGNPHAAENSYDDSSRDSTFGCDRLGRLGDGMWHRTRRQSVEHRGLAARHWRRGRQDINASGGTATGGISSASGGTTTGGISSASGGTATGGISSASGGTATGGISSASGGVSTGGNASGGNASGGNPSGGMSTGGKATGGNASGGASTGGKATGGGSPGGGGGASSRLRFGEHHPPAAPSGTTCSLDVSGTPRTYYVQLCPRATARPRQYPVIFQFHPWGGSADQALTMYQLKSRYRAIYVTPQGLHP